jgi:cell wall-associated NlpC family hydrolase
VAWSSGAYQKYVNEARQAVAQASSVTGNPAIPTGPGAATPGSAYGPPGPQITNAGIGTDLRAAEDISGPLANFWIRGTQVAGDFAAAILGAPTYTAGMDTVPNIVFSIADPDGGLLYDLDQHGWFWTRGGSVTYEDLYLRMDTIKFEPGGHTTGQLTIAAADEIVYKLMELKGPRTASGISATEWIAQELRIVGIDPNIYFLGESVPTQTVIARDEADQAGSSSGIDNQPSAWTTIVRLAKELGKRVFISGRRLVFGSAGFAMAWAAPGTLKLSYHSLSDAERFLSLPTATRVSIGNRQGIMQVQGKIPLNRAKYFRPGARVALEAIPSVVAQGPLIMMVEKIAHSIGTDTDGADITLLEPVDPPPQPPSTATAAGANGGPTSAGGTPAPGSDSQISRFVALALQQAGKRYVYGAEASPSDPNPRAFDCSELVQWCADRIGITPAVPDGSDAQKAHCKPIPVTQGINTKGALLFAPGHVAISLGNGKTIEAMNESAGIRQGNATTSRFNAAGLIPGASGYP